MLLRRGGNVVLGVYWFRTWGEGFWGQREVRERWLFEYFATGASIVKSLPTFRATTTKRDRPRRVPRGHP